MRVCYDTQTGRVHVDRRAPVASPRPTPAPPPRRPAAPKQKRAAERPAWFETFNPQAGVPAEETAGYRRAQRGAAMILDNILRIVDQPPAEIDVQPALILLDALDDHLYGASREEMEDPEWWADNDAAIRPEDLGEWTGSDAYGWSAEETADAIVAGLDAESRGGFRPDDELREAFARHIWEIDGRLELVRLSKEVACSFISEHHSALPQCNPRGMMYAIGALLGGRLVAVATAGTPTGRWSGHSCPVDGILELTRIASVGGLTRRDRRGREVPVNASSALAARLLDLLPSSGRRGVPGCRFVTYSLAGERGTTYLSLVSKGLRPVARRRGQAPAGARRGGDGTALPDVDKVVWEAGEAARPPDWTLIPAEREAGAQRAYETYLGAQARRRA